MSLETLKEKAESLKKHLKNNAVAYACGLGAVTVLGSGDYEVKNTIGPDGHAGIEIVKGKGNLAAGIALGTLAAAPLFLGAMKKMSDETRDVRRKDEAKSKNDVFDAALMSKMGRSNA